ncbi:unnamed protein product [Leptidea sinapis]|uniref:Uncharacterized protein n=1 Tax=Leptidea sinapis TaxID=189913 RepID=A0A5E4Q651_9NEOP|nr:unnamed protein product [Leptidea sinapis]
MRVWRRRRGRGRAAGAGRARRAGRRAAARASGRRRPAGEGPVHRELPPGAHAARALTDQVHIIYDIRRGPPRGCTRVWPPPTCW